MKELRNSGGAREAAGRDESLKMEMTEAESAGRIGGDEVLFLAINNGGQRMTATGEPAVPF